MPRSCVLAVVLLTLSCGGLSKGGEPAVGDACFPEDEAIAKFNGTNIKEFGFSRDSTRCGPDLFCLRYHFQGRVTCPYGQTQEEMDTLPVDDPARCRVPDEQGNMTSQPVTLPVAPQLLERRPEDVIFCTCECGNDPTCTCPAGFECEAPIPRNWGIAYCIKSAFKYDRTMPPTAVCEKAGTDPSTDCGNERRNP